MSRNDSCSDIAILVLHHRQAGIQPDEPNQ